MRVRLPASLGLVVFLAGSCTDDVPAAPPPDAPRIIRFTVDQARVTRGQRVTLTLETEHATEVQVLDDAGRQLALSGSVEASTVTLQPEVSTFFVARVQGEGGRDVAFVQVAVDAPPREVFLLAVPSTIDPGADAQLVWGSDGLEGLSIMVEGGAALPLTSASGATTVSPARSTRYTLQAGDGSTLTAVAEVRVRPLLRAVELQSVSGTGPGAVIGVHWVGGGAQRIVVRELTFGQLGEVTDLTRLDDGTLEWTVPASLPSGQAVQNGLPLTFTVEASSNAGSVSTSVRGVVGTAPVIERVEAPSAATLGQTFLLAWNTLGAAKVGVEIDGRLVFETLDSERARAAAGSVTLPTPPASAEYAVVATNDFGVSARRVVTVRPVVLPVISSFTVSPQGISSSGDQVTFQWVTTGARRVRLHLEGGPTLFTSTSLASNGSTQLRLGGRTVVVLEAINEAGDSVSERRTIALSGTPPVTLTPNPTLRGTQPTLTWSLDSLGVTEVVGLPTPMPAEVTGSPFVDLGTTAGTTEVLFPDPNEGVAELRLPESFRFPFGGLQSTLFVSVNGYLSLQPTFTNPFNNQDLTLAANATPSLIAPFWDDLTMSATSKVWSGFITTGPSGERRFAVQWTQLQRAGFPGTSVTFQVQLWETGQITFVYGPLSGDTGEGATVGLKSVELGVVQQRSFQTGGLAEGLRYDFFAGGAPTGSVLLPAGPSRRVSFFARVATGLIPFSVQTISLAPGDVSLSEAMPFPEASVGSTGQWVEVRNRTAGDLDLAGLVLSTASSDAGFVFPPNTTLPANGYLAVGQSTDPAQNGGANVTVSWVGVSLAQTNETVRLSVEDTPIAELAWDTSTAGRSVQIADGLLQAGGGANVLCTRGSRTFGPTGAIGTPGAANEPCTPYVVERIDGGYVDILSTGSIVLKPSSQYDGWATVPLPVPFTYYGQTFTEVQVSLVGFLAFDPTPLTETYDVTNDVTPETTAPNGTVAIFWDQISRNTNGAVYLRRESNRTIISWNDFRIYATTSSLNFQVHLYDSGVIEFHYGPFSLSTNTEAARGRVRGSSATVWLEAPGGGAAMPAGVNTDGTIQTNTGIRFTP